MTTHRFRNALRNGDFAITAEIGPPKSADPEKVREKGRLLKGCAHASNITDNQTAVARLSSIASAVLLREMDMEPVVQMTCRDRNRLALQSDLLSIGALGLSNVLILTGDHQSFGNHPGARGVYDVDSVQLLRAAADLRSGRFMNGEEMKGAPPDYTIGAVISPFSFPQEHTAPRLEKKARAGAEFVQTQAIFDIAKFEDWMKDVRARGIHETTHILAGIAPLKSIRIAKRMKDMVPGVEMPGDLYGRLESAKDFQKESLKVAVETIDAVRKIDGVHGVHLMAVMWESIIPELVESAGLFREII